MYRALNMGGITDWAIDLQGFRDPPISEGWDAFKLTISAGGDPFILGERTGNWTTLQCTDPAVVGDLQFTPEARWSMLDCDSAWNDALDVWRNHHNKTGGPTFSASIWDTFHGPPGAMCHTLLTETNCDEMGNCYVHKGSGPAAHLVMNALVSVHQVRIPGSSVLIINPYLGVPISSSTLLPCLIHSLSFHFRFTRTSTGLFSKRQASFSLVSTLSRTSSPRYPSHKMTSPTRSS
jgi:hypothetical protein